MPSLTPHNVVPTRCCVNALTHPHSRPIGKSNDTSYPTTNIITCNYYLCNYYFPIASSQIVFFNFTFFTFKHSQSSIFSLLLMTH